MNLPCPSDATLVELVEGVLDESGVSAASRHLDSCPSCRRVVNALQTASGVEGEPSRERRPTSSPASFGRGATVARYVVLDKIGSGGMGVVFSAYDPELDRKIALKVLRTDTGHRREDMQARLLREARAMALISHPNVIIVHDVGTVGDHLFVAMELVTGGTLSRILAGVHRSPKEILDLFGRAGDGLAAAHRAGLVHRDFKPENVLVGEDGRVRVTDFGLVRRVDVRQPELQPATEGSPASPETAAATHAGARLGTPAYMAPEQHAGGIVDARSDQFAFCVALYEALYRQRPFTGTTVTELAAAVSLGKMRAPPVDSKVPRWIEPVLRRGLSTRPEDRFASMSELLATLRRMPSRRGRRAAAAVGAVVLASFLAVGGAARTKLPPPCGQAAAAIARAWNPERRARVATAFERTGKPFAGDAARLVAGELDARTASWAAARTEACEATRVRGAQTERMLDLRTACLDRNARSLEALVTLLEHADADLVARGGDAVHALPGLDGCAPDALASSVDRPSEPEAKARVAEVEAELAGAEARLAAGKFADLEPDASAIVERARAAGFGPVLADALGVLADAQARNEHAAASEQTLYACLWAAEASHADHRAARAWTNLVRVVVGKQGRAAEEARLVGHAQAFLKRIGGDPRIELDLLHFQGGAAGARGEWGVAASWYRQELALAARAGAPEELTSRALDALARMEVQLGDLTQALEHERTSLDLLVSARGPAHPDVAGALETMAGALWMLGRYDEALSEQRRVLSIRLTALRADNFLIPLARSNLASALCSTGRPAEALAEATKAVAEARDALDVRDEMLAGFRAQVARSLLLLGRLREAEAEAEAALALRHEQGGSSDAWFCEGVMGDVLRSLHKPAAAREHYRAIVDEESASRGPYHPNVAVGLTGMGRCDIAEGQAARAVDLLERALAIQTAHEGDPADRAETGLVLADALWRAGRGRERAVDLARAAYDFYAGAGSAKLVEAAEAEGWLREHRISAK